MIKIGPVGNIVQGDILDVNKKAFERVLRDYDSLLYVKWNPTKLKGFGCWEIRRRPATKSAVYAGTHNDVNFFEIKHVEYDMIHHVLDVAFLNYDAINKLKRMDTFATSNWIDGFESREKEAKAIYDKKLKEDLKYSIKQIKTQAAGLREAVLSGTNLAELAKHWGSSK